MGSEQMLYEFENDISPLQANEPKRFKHPTAALFHVAFKLAAFVVYLFGGFIFDEAFLGTFVALILLISMDFWTVKNVTGRLLVGLRWWNFIDDEGNSHWVFENKNQRNQNDTNFKLSLTDGNVGVADASLFWSALILTPIIWFIFLLATIFRFSPSWFMIVMLALVLSSSNLYGYVRCKLGSGESIKSAVTQYVGKQLIFNFMSSAGQAAKNNVPSYPTA